MEKQINSYQTLTKLVYAILLNYKEKKSDVIDNYYNKIHKNFFELKKKHPNFFYRLAFDINGSVPISDELDSIIQDLQVSGAINKLNPKFNTLIVKGETNTQKYLENELDCIKKEELDVITNEFGA